MKTEYRIQWTMIILQTIFSLRIPFRHKNTLQTITFKVNIFRTSTMHIFIQPFLTLETFYSAFVKCLSIKIHSQSIHTTKPNMRSVQIKKFSFFYKSLTNPCIDCYYSNYKKCTGVRNIVQFLYSFDKE